MTAWLAGVGLTVSSGVLLAALADIVATCRRRRYPYATAAPALAVTGGAWALFSVLLLLTGDWLAGPALALPPTLAELARCPPDLTDPNDRQWWHDVVAGPLLASEDPPELAHPVA